MSENLNFIESIASAHERAIEESRECDYSAVFGLAREAGKVINLVVSFKHVQLGQKWCYVPNLEHNTKIIPELNSWTHQPATALSPYSNDQQWQPLIGLVGTLKEGNFVTRFDVAPTECEARYSLYVAENDMRRINLRDFLVLV